MRVLQPSAFAWAISLAAGCAIFMDNGTHLGFALERESRALLASGHGELVFDYSQLTGINQRYEVELSASRSQKLYESFGFERCGPFGDYKDDPNSVFMSKRL